MKKSSYPKFISEIYKEAGYSDEIVTNIEWWESQHPSVEILLEGYRYIQPDGELFSESSLKIIITLYDMEYMLEAQKELIYDMKIKLRTLIKWGFKQKNKPDEFIFENDLF
jgi:hypothetical protein